MISWFARNPVAANLLMLFIIFMGLLSVNNRIPLEIFPDVSLNTVSIQVQLRGSTPQEVEQGITIRIEEAVQDLEGIERITSRSQEGVAEIRLEVAHAVDERDLLADVKTRIDALNTLPEEAEKPVIQLRERRREVITVAVSSRYGERETRQIADQIRDQLLTLPAITRVELDAAANYEIAIEIPNDNLVKFDLSLDQVATAIRNSSLDLSAGNLKHVGGEIFLRSTGQAYAKGDFENIIVKQGQGGALIRLKDIASIEDGFEESRAIMRFNGQPAIFLQVYQLGDQNAIEISHQVKTFLQQRQATLPDGIFLDYWRDRSRVVHKRLQTLVNNALLGGVLVIALLSLFLRPGVAFWVFLGIPVSFMGAFIFMPVLGVTFNVVSLFAFILVLGIVVDDAIVTGENIYTHLKKGEPGVEAAIAGTQEIAVPVTFGVLTTVVAFMPILFIEGIRGQIFAQIPMVVIPVFLFSLIESKLVLPAHLSRIRTYSDPHRSNRMHWQEKFSIAFESWVTRYYQPFAQICLQRRATVIVSLFALLLLSVILLLQGWIKFTFFPRIDTEVIQARLVMPVGTPLKVTESRVQQIADAATQLKQELVNETQGEPIIENILVTVGSNDIGTGDNLARVLFEVTAPEERQFKITSREIVQKWKQQIGRLPGIDSLVFRAEIGRTSDPIDIQLRGQDMAQLRRLAAEITTELGKYPGVFNIDDSLSDGKPELNLSLNQLGHALGIQRAELIRQVRAAYEGIEVQRMQRGREEVRVVLRAPLKERQSLDQLKELPIQTADGKRIPLSHIAEWQPGVAPVSIQRIDRFRTVNVVADVNKNEVNMLRLQQELNTFVNQLVAPYPDIYHSFEGEAKEQRQAFGSLKYGLIFVLFAIYTLLAIPLKSYVQPLIVMSVIPFSLIGAFAGHLIMGHQLSMMSILGMLALVGVVVNDSLVLVDHINKQWARQGYFSHELIVEAGVRRFRPVFLTSATTFIGLMPLLFDKSTQAQFLIPMAISLGFGILFATLLTLILVPICYSLLHEVQDKLSLNNKFSKDGSV